MAKDKDKEQKGPQYEAHVEKGIKGGVMEGTELTEETLEGEASQGGVLVGGPFGKGVDEKMETEHHEGDYLTGEAAQGIAGPVCEGTEDIRTESGADVGSPLDKHAQDRKPTQEEIIKGGGVETGTGP